MHRNIYIHTHIHTYVRTYYILRQSTNVDPAHYMNIHTVCVDAYLSMLLHACMFYIYIFDISIYSK